MASSTSSFRRSVPSIASTKQQSHPLPLSTRLLFPSLPANTPPPPLLSSPHSSQILNQDLYNFIALALRAYLIPWWSKITRYDKELLPEITRILTALIRALESRILATDLAPLVFNDLPLLITQHYRDIRSASAKLSTSYAAGGSASLPQLFHQLQHHMALSPDGRVDEVYIRQVIDHILKSCLPPEDYAPEAERFIIREVVLKVLLQDVIPKITEPWFVHRTLLDLLGPAEEEVPRTTKPSHASSSSFSFLLVFFLSAVQSISGACLALIHAYKHAVSTIKAVNKSSPTPRPPHPPPPEKSTNSPYISPSPSSSTSSFSSPHSQHPRNDLRHDDDNDPDDDDNNDFARAPLQMVAEIFTLQDRFASSAIASSVFLFSALFSPFLDRLLPHLLYTHLLSTQRLLHIIRLSTHTLFPNGYPAPPPQIPTQAEQVALRAALQQRLVDVLSSLSFSEFSPSPGSDSSSGRSSDPSSRSGTGNSRILGRILLGPTVAERAQTIERALDGVRDQACNTHLVVFILDAIVLRLFPELGVAGGGGGERDGLHSVSADMSRSVSGATTNMHDRDSSLTPPGSIPS